MALTLAAGLLIPFLGTTLGAACVLFMKNEMSNTFQKALLGFASGVMVAASVWSLLIPSMESVPQMGKWRFVPAVAGLMIGFCFLLMMDALIPHLHLHAEEPEGLRSNFSRITMLVLAVTLHNLPEGMAVGVVFAGFLSGNATVSLAGAMSLAIGIAIQNFPEGAIVSMPMKSDGGASKGKAFLLGTLSGAVEPLGALLMIALTRVMEPVLPYMLSFAAGAMLYVVIEELIPEASEGKHSNWSTMGFAIGFSIMMVLDVALG